MNFFKILRVSLFLLVCIVLQIEYIQVIAQNNVLINQLEERNKNEPSNLDIIIQLAKLYYDIDGMMHNVIFYADKGLKIDPGNNILYDLKIKGLMNIEENNKAISFINSNIRRKGTPSSLDILRRGQCKFNLGNKTMALEDFQYAYSLDPKNTEIQFALGYTKAIIADDKNFSNKYIDMALEKIKSGDSTLFFNKNNLADIYYRKALNLEREGNKDVAVKYIEKSLELNPYNPDSNIWNGRRDLLAHRYQSAIYYFENAISEQNRAYKRSDIMGYIALCKYYIAIYRQDRSYRLSKDEAYSALMSAVNSGNRFGAVYFFLGRLIYEKGGVKEAADFFAKAIDNEYNEHEQSKEAVDGWSFHTFISYYYSDALNYLEYNEEK